MDKTLLDVMRDGIDAPLKRAESIPPNDVNAPINPGPDDCAERPECALSFADLARLRVEAGELPSSETEPAGRFKITPPQTYVVGESGPPVTSTELE